MENLIPFIIMLLVGSFLSSKRKKPTDEQEQAKPFTAQGERHDGPVKKLKEMYEEIQKELEEENEKQRPAPQMTQRTMPKPEVKITPERVEVAVPLREKRTEPTRQSRPSRFEEKQVVKKQNKTPRSGLMPKSQDDIMKGVIFSEIFGPPKSKR